MEFCVRIANKTILIESSNSSLKNMCKDYLVEDFERPDIEIHINDDMLNTEFARVKQFNTEIYRPSSMEGRLIHRIIAEALLDYDVVLMHGAVVAVEIITDRVEVSQGEIAVGIATPSPVEM